MMWFPKGGDSIPFRLFYSAAGLKPRPRSVFVYWLFQQPARDLTVRRAVGFLINVKQGKIQDLSRRRLFSRPCDTGLKSNGQKST